MHSCFQRLSAHANNVATTGAALESGGRSDNVDGESIETERLEEILRVGVDFEGNTLGVESRDLGNVVVLALTLLLLKLEGDTANGSLLNTLHKVGSESGNLVAEALRGNDGNLIADLLVGVEVKGQARVVLLDDDAGSTLDGLSTNAAPVRIRANEFEVSSCSWKDVGRR